MTFISCNTSLDLENFTTNCHLSVKRINTREYDCHYKKHPTQSKKALGEFIRLESASGILPIFALANAGIVLGDVTIEVMADPVTVEVSKLVEAQGTHTKSKLAHQWLIHSGFHSYSQSHIQAGPIKCEHFWHPWKVSSTMKCAIFSPNVVDIIAV